MNLNFEFENSLTDCFKKLGINNRDSTYITGNLGALGRIRIEKNLKMSLFLKALRNRAGNDANIFSPSASMNLMNTKISYDIDNTPSHEMGAFAEYFRILPDSIRTNHPFWSISGQGSDAFRLKNVSKHSYGAGSPWTIFLELEVKQITMGIHPSKAVSLIHHIETIFGVPYRYTKEFMQPIKYGEKIIEEKFYQSVMYKDCLIKKKITLNKHFFDELELQGKLKKFIHKSGLVFWSFKMRDFYDIVIGFFKKDIYTYLEAPPLKRPYSN